MSARPSARRIVCAVAPLFPLAAWLRSEPDLYGEAVAILAGRGAKARVVAATRRARRAGIRSGVTLAEARARLPNLIARSRAIECERAAQEALLDVAESFSSRIEGAGDGVVYLDIPGLEQAFGGKGRNADVELGRALAEQVVRRAGVPVWVGVAASKLAARVAAEEGGIKVVPPGHDAEYLSQLPLDRLSREADTLSILRRWRVHSLGELARLPPSEVVSRLGPGGEQLHAIARGVDLAPLVPRTPPHAFREGMKLNGALVCLEPLLFVIRAALERLLKRMEGCGVGCQRLEVSLKLERNGCLERSVKVPAPTRDLKTLFKLVQLDLEAHQPGTPVVAFALTAHPDQPREAQRFLPGAEGLSPDKLATTLALVFSLLDVDRVSSPRIGERFPREDIVPAHFEPPHL